ncbi:MAG: DUF438 domain-containing protein [Brevinematales bacterium]|nr:DUF438 domain-containing protein [Brevinematales bacterium]
MAETLVKDEHERKIAQLKELFRSLKDESDHKKALYLRKEFKEFLAQCDARDISDAEKELAKEGFTLKDFRSGCDVHLELMRESLGQQGSAIPEGHPLYRFHTEHGVISCWIEELLGAIRGAEGAETFGAAGAGLETVKKLAAKLRDSENHSVRQENALFPLLEQRGITEPPRVMWGEHKEMKEMKTSIETALNTITAENYQIVLSKMEETALLLAEYFAAHTRKEETILYPIAMKSFTGTDWNDFKSACDELGYFSLE